MAISEALYSASKDAARAAVQATAALVAAPIQETVRYTPGSCALVTGPSTVLHKQLEALRVTGLRPARCVMPAPIRVSVLAG